jgi:hypothetical protein
MRSWIGANSLGVKHKGVRHESFIWIPDNDPHREIQMMIRRSRCAKELGAVLVEQAWCLALSSHELDTLSIVAF